MKKIFFVTFFTSFITLTYSQSLIRDNSFGNMGIVNTNYQSYGGLYLTKIILLDDHKFICVNAGKSMIRFNEDGTVDNSFGINGHSQAPVYPTSLGFFNIKLINGYFYALGTNYTNTLSNLYDAFICRFTYDGLIDTTFGNNGYVSYHINEYEYFYNMVFTSDNKIIAIGIKKVQNSDPYGKLLIARFSSDGLIDSSFQNNGYKEIAIFPLGIKKIENVSNVDNNKFMVACTDPAEYPFSATLAIVKFDTDGNLDLSFNTSGIKMYSTGNVFNQQSRWHSVNFFGNYLYAISADTNVLYSLYPAALSKINLLTLAQQNTNISRKTVDYVINSDFSITALSTTLDPANLNPIKDLFITKYDSNGNLDNGFCNAGIYQFNLSNINNYLTDDMASSLAIYDDKILVLGQYQLPQTAYDDFKSALTRFSQVTLSVDTFQKDKISITPNPSSNYIKVNLKDISYPANIKIFNPLGQKVYESTIFNNDNELQIKIDNFQSNLYMLKIIDYKNNVYNKKFLKE
jgi:uncharacterized delta-60 repeat protein